MATQAGSVSGTQPGSVFSGQHDRRKATDWVCEELKAELGSGPLIADLDDLLGRVREASFAGNGLVRV